MNEPIDSHHYATVGFTAVITMMHLGCEVSIHGFDFFNSSTQYHYYEKVSPRAQSGAPNHPMDDEKNILEHLVNIGKIKRL